MFDHIGTVGDIVLLKFGTQLFMVSRFLYDGRV